MSVQAHCEELDQSDHYMLIIYVWFSLVTSALAALLLYTVTMAAITRRRINQHGDSHSVCSQGEGSEVEIEVDCSNYEVVPQEVEKRRKTSHLADIAEDDESEGSEGEQGRKGSNYSVSNESKTVSTSSLISGASGYSRSSSECHQVSRHSLAVPGKSNLKRTESQTRADYVLKVSGRGRGGEYQRDFIFYIFVEMMTQGGNIRDYSAPTNTREKFSPTGRKISVDSKVRFQQDFVQPKTYGNRIHSYENIPNVMSSISSSSISERHSHPDFDIQSTNI